MYIRIHRADKIDRRGLLAEGERCHKKQEEKAQENPYGWNGQRAVVVYPPSTAITCPVM